MPIETKNRLGRTVHLVHRATGIPVEPGESVKYGSVTAVIAKGEYGAMAGASTGFIDTDRGTFLPASLGLEWRLK